MAARGHSVGASIYGDLERPRRWLDEARCEGRRSGVVQWRQTLTVSAAAQRARAGDRTAGRRLAWRDLVLKGRRHAEWLVSRYKAHETALARIRREPSTSDCAACYLRQERSRRTRDEYLADISALPQSVPTYAEYRDREDATAAEAATWLRRQLEGLDGGRT